MFMLQIAHDLARRYTVDEVRAFPSDGNRYELVDGQLLVSPAPSVVHQTVLGRLHYTIRAYLQTFGLADTLFFSPADISWNHATLVQPDLFVAYPEEVSQRWETIQRLRLVAEVLSPSTAGQDRITKRHAYQEHGVETYWIVDPDARQIEVWTPEAAVSAIVTDVAMWRVRPGDHALTIDVQALFG
jgi:Uma2 family endonuclease